MEEGKNIEQKEQPKEESKEAPLSIIERAELANKKAEDNIRRQEELLRRQEELAAKNLLSGRAFAGQTKTAQQTEEEKLNEEVQKALKKYR